MVIPIICVNTQYVTLYTQRHSVLFSDKKSDDLLFCDIAFSLSGCGVLTDTFNGEHSCRLRNVAQAHRNLSKDRSTDIFISNSKTNRSRNDKSVAETDSNYSWNDKSIAETDSNYSWNDKSVAKTDSDYSWNDKSVAKTDSNYSWNDKSVTKYEYNCNYRT